MNIQWFPGHMAKTQRLITENIKLCDLYVEILDSRVAYSSQNHYINSMINKPKIIILNKCDIADKEVTKQWVTHFQKQGITAIPTNSHDPSQKARTVSAFYRVLGEKIEQNKAKGVNKELMLMVAGIPNVGKSSFINCLVSKKMAKTGDRPGVTKGKQWIKLKDNWLLLDTPGVLWHKFQNDQIALNLAYTGAIKDAVYDVYLVAVSLLSYLQSNYKAQLIERYKLKEEQMHLSPEALIEEIARKRGYVITGGERDVERASVMLLDEFRAAKLGNISLEAPGRIEDEA